MNWIDRNSFQRLETTYDRYRSLKIHSSDFVDELELSSLGSYFINERTHSSSNLYITCYKIADAFEQLHGTRLVVAGRNSTGTE